MRRKAWFITAALVLVGGAAAGLILLPGRGRPIDYSPRDWPLWRCDAARSAVGGQELPDQLHLQWVRRLGPQTPAWPEAINRDRMGYDRCYEPVVAGTTMFVGFNASDKVVALDTRTGAERWRFYADGPVRFAPAVWRGRVFFVSDDGFLYCLDAADGSLRWRFRGGPSDLRVLGNERLVSAWPARGGPVIDDQGAVYFAAGIWPFMGVFVHALDAETGRLLWTNDGSGQRYTLQPHTSWAFAGPAPQGALAVAGDTLLVPSGRSSPAGFDRRSGELLFYDPGENAHRGGALVSAVGPFFFNQRGLGTEIYDLASGEFRVGKLTGLPVLADDAYYLGGDPVTALAPASFRRIDYTQKVWNARRRRMVDTPAVRWEIDPAWRLALDPSQAGGALIKAGRKLYSAGKGGIAAIDLADGRGRQPAVSWSAKVDGRVAQLLAADGRLFAVTLEGAIYAFGAEPAEPAEFAPLAAPAAAPPSAPIDELLKLVGADAGYCLARGAGDAELLEQLAEQSELKIFVIDRDAARVDALRRRWDDAGLHYGRRLSILADDPLAAAVPPYVASVTVLDDPSADRLFAAGGADGEWLAKVFASARPYGGAIVMPAAAGRAEALSAAAASARLHGARVASAGRWLALFRDGPLEGAGQWTGQYGDAANTVNSHDRIVRAPLGVLWFGGPSHDDVLPRHGHGPPEQVVAGRLFIEGIDSIAARDVYTGRTLWTRRLGDMDTFNAYYNASYRPDPLDTSYNQQHLPGANARGSNFLATDEVVYVAQHKHCEVLDAADGRTVGQFRIPAAGDRAGDFDTWGTIAPAGRTLIVAADAMTFPRNLDLMPEAKADFLERYKPFLNFDGTTSRRIVALDGRSGAVRWRRSAELGFRHGAIAIGAGKVFCIDALPPLVADALAREGRAPAAAPALLALDAASGELLWRRTDPAFGTWLSYSAEADLLIQAGRASRDMVLGEPDDRIVALRGADGQVAWDRWGGYEGPVIIRGDTLHTQTDAFDLRTGEPKLRPHPLTGQPILWRFRREHGCNTVIASENLLTFRSAAAGYYDLAADSGTANLGGFRSGCTSNLIAADGVLNAPDYTRTCTCSYQNQTSLALVPMPGLETWTFSRWPKGVGRVRRAGLNLGAPGDRLADDGTLWLDWPSVGGRSPDLPIEQRPEPDEPGWRVLRRHSSTIQSPKATAPAWVAASGVEGLRSLTVRLHLDVPRRDLADGECVDGFELKPPSVYEPMAPTPYTVRLCFAELGGKRAGERVFDVSLQGRRVLEGFDIAAAAGGPFRPIVREFRNVVVEYELAIELSPAAAAPGCQPLLCGVELIAEPAEP